MKPPPESYVQVLIEPGLPKSGRKKSTRSPSGKATTFQNFRFTRKGNSGSLVLQSGEESADPRGSKITVFRFAPKSGDYEAARKLVKQYSSTSQPLIAIASPGVYNQPDFRSILLDHHVEVFVEGEESFDIQDLAPWIAKLSQASTTPKRNQTSHRKSAEPILSATEPLELGQPLRDPDSGRLDARKIATLLGISLTDLATKVCGVTKQNLSQSPTSAGIQDKLADLEEIAGLLSWCGSEAKLKAWLKRPNRDFAPLNGRILSPVDLILMGRARSVANKVHHMLLGHPS